MGRRPVYRSILNSASPDAGRRRRRNCKRRPKNNADSISGGEVRKRRKQSITPNNTFVRFAFCTEKATRVCVRMSPSNHHAQTTTSCITKRNWRAKSLRIYFRRERPPVVPLYVRTRNAFVHETHLARSFSKRRISAPKRVFINNRHPSTTVYRAEGRVPEI